MFRSGTFVASVALPILAAAGCASGGPVPGVPEPVPAAGAESTPVVRSAPETETASCCGGHEAPAPVTGEGETPRRGSSGGDGEAPILVDLGAGFCPVKGEPADGTSSVEWMGLRIGLCCPGCASEFLTDPVAYLDAVAPEWKEAVVAEESAMEAETQEERELAMEDLARWTIVRRPPPIPWKGLLADLGNTRCPVTLEDADHASFAEWNGLRVGLCCAACASHFWPHPDLVLDHAKIEWREAAEAVRKADAAHGPGREVALRALGAKWKVVRDADGEAGAPGHCGR